MNTLEYSMIEILKKLKDYGVFEIKAEFEAEGSRMEELMRLKDVTSKVDLPIILKIGGVEAVTDVYNALSIGVKGIVAPMVETPFALYKYTNMIKTMIAEDNAKDIEFAFNVETVTACAQFHRMVIHNPIKSITIGRVDLTASAGYKREDINTIEVTNLYINILKAAKSRGLKTALGGGISKESLPILADLKDLLDKFETRKVVFPIMSYAYGEAAITEALRFELLWLQSKRRYYSGIKAEDEKRIEMLERRIC